MKMFKQLLKGFPKEAAQGGASAQNQKGPDHSPEGLSRKRGIWMGGIGLGLVGVIWILMPSSQGESPQKAKSLKTKMTPPAKVVDDKEIWVSRVEARAEKAEKRAEMVQKENRYLEERLNAMEMLLKERPVQSGPVDSKEQGPFRPLPQTNSGRAVFPDVPYGGGGEDLQSPEASIEPRLAHLQNRKSAKKLPKTVETYVPAGTHVKSVLLSGVVANTGAAALSDPSPILVRLRAEGDLPRGFKSDLRDGVMIGSCYGQLSSERAICRVHMMSLTEKNGEIIEKAIEGWILGEDGRPGLKGEVVDRSAAVAQGAFMSGILGGAANFFKQRAVSSVFPVSPFGESNSMSTKELLQGGAAQGTGNALEKLADFSIRRAENMEPVIMVSAGREVDVVFKKGVDMSDSTFKADMRAKKAAQYAAKYEDPKGEKK